MYIDDPTLHIPIDFPTPKPSEFLTKHLIKIKSVWVLNNEKSCRLVIDAILTEVLDNAKVLDNDEFLDNDAELLGFCHVKNDWEGPGFGYTGNVDYMFGFSNIKSVDTMDSNFLLVGAKKEWPDSDIPKVLCQAGCLLKRRLAAGKNTPVFAALSNGLFFRFFAIDTNGIVVASKPRQLEIGDDGTYNSSLSEILAWFTWFMASMKSFSSPSVDLTGLRTCFGPKNPIYSKRVKLQSKSMLTS